MPTRANPQREPGPPTTPQRFPETTPTTYPGSEYSFVLQGVFDIQKSIGKLEQAVQTLTEQQKGQGEKLDKLSHKFTAAIAIVLFLGALLTFLSPFANTVLSHLFPK
jgi:hypothetical protein